MDEQTDASCMYVSISFGLTVTIRELLVELYRISAQNLSIKSSLVIFSPFFVFFFFYFRPGAETQARGANYHTETALVIID